ncbi:23S rRNA (adenine(2503)-C(2))-methyltransferase RlmN [Candidatus Acetothermia bacterium]|jgi:23S rRNA (adenine2503-C2)-methyltransferase|nr:23S rRNA (adenine(2503)-C(2))-methyltransferase RlmN [Candidatus Acetothermia bacterium]MCI2427529.1 23S rRNA (adenine(2503)-C(2))-methyltransferase RlmN [Candidatus Acetothermia bacterium]MCI2428044.1 23S rRNA (adenine(2503)-C(2))-methyltransferase RlmN [Candidatus Acetothermia bacterium]
MSNSHTLLEFDRRRLAEFLAARNEPKFRVAQIWHALYRDLVSSYAEITTIPASLRQALIDDLRFDTIRPIHTAVDRCTEKVLFQLADGEMIEAVLMRYDQRNTLCVSTQVGCSLNCRFCATGQSGFKRNLTIGEIIAQTLYFARRLRTEERKNRSKISNVVYMGMGEPFLNYSATIASVKILNDTDGFALGERRFSISTIGIIPAIERFSREKMQVNLAVSLHSAKDALRNELIPINRTYPLAALIKACSAYIQRTRRRITFEYALINEVNDSLSDARQLAELIQGLLCHVNLIPLNPVSGVDLHPSSAKRRDSFQAELKKRGISVSMRLGRGLRIEAGCGQLRVRKA